jgi:ectoine hydroxylase-related dioxygenase (phytanoyl-CoA dioxygenase family)
MSMPTTTDALVAPYLLTDDEVRSFDENGYLVLRNRIPADLLARLQAAATTWMAEGREISQDDPAAIDYHYANRAIGRVMFRVDYVHNKGQAASLELLGSPAVLGIAESLAGSNFVPTYESLVFKNEGDGAAIEWHQDAVHPRNYRVFNVDVYLDASRIGQGALRVAPGSHRQPVDICDLKDTYGWDAPGVVQVEMEPGDVLVHDVMVVHGSEAVTGNKLRRTIYYEFRAAEQIMSEGPWDAAWVDQRLRLIPLGLAEHAATNPDKPQFQWKISSEFAPETSGDTAAELRVAHTAHSPGSYCSAGSVPLAK